MQLLRALSIRLIALSLLAAACSPTSDGPGTGALRQELAANQVALAALADSLVRHSSVAALHLKWMEQLVDAGSSDLFDAMRTLGVRPVAEVRRSAFDDLFMAGELAAAVPDGETRRSLIEHYRALASIEHAAEHEYRRVAEHYEKILGPGEWRVVMTPDIGEEMFPVDYRRSLQLLFEDDHEATLRGLIRAQAEYLRLVSSTAEQAQDLLSTLDGDAR